jgi:hypothetical protein
MIRRTALALTAAGILFSGIRLRGGQQRESNKGGWHELDDHELVHPWGVDKEMNARLANEEFQEQNRHFIQ